MLVPIHSAATPRSIFRESVCSSIFGNWERENLVGVEGGRIHSPSITGTQNLLPITTLSFDIQRNPTLQLAPNFAYLALSFTLFFPHIGATRDCSAGALGGRARDSGQW
jgi:hypothetical protein